MIIAENLNFNVTGREHIFLDQNLRVPEAGATLAARRVESLGKISGTLDAAHPFAAATRYGFDQHRITDFLSLCCQKTLVLIVAMVSRHDGHTGLFHQHLGGIL